MVILMLIFVILTISAFGLLGDLCSEGFDVGCSTYFHFLCIQSSRAYMDTSQNVVQLLPPPVPLLFPSPITRGAEGSQQRSVDAFFFDIKIDRCLPVAQALLSTMGLRTCMEQQPKKNR